MAVRNAPQQPFHAADLQKIRPLGELAAQLVQLLRDSRQAVTLLQPQPPRVDQPGRLPGPEGGPHRQGWSQVRTLGNVQLHPARPGQLLEIGYNTPVPLGGVRVQALHRQRAPQPGGSQPEGGLGVVRLLPQSAAAVLLASGHPEALGQLLHPDAPVPQHLEGHVHIPSGLQRGGEPDDALPLQQRQGKEQARDELRRHIPRHGILPGTQPAPDRQGVPLPAVGDPHPVKDPEVGLLGPVHQPPPSPKHASALQGQRHRDQEPQCGARLSALQHRELPLPFPQALQAVPGGPDILGIRPVGGVVQVLPRQRPGDQQPVGLALGGRRRHRPGQQPRLDHHCHMFRSFSRCAAKKRGTHR